MKRSIFSLILLPFVLLSCGALWQSDSKSPVDLARTGAYKTPLQRWSRWLRATTSIHS
jgi:L-asparaginase II